MENPLPPSTKNTKVLQARGPNSAEVPEISPFLKKGSLSRNSLLLSLLFYIWWLCWPLLSLIEQSDSPVELPLVWGLINKISQALQQLWLGLPLWFCLSSIISLLLLFLLCWIYLPKEDNPHRPIRTNRMAKEAIHDS